MCKGAVSPTPQTYSESSTGRVLVVLAATVAHSAATNSLLHGFVRVVRDLINTVVTTRHTHQHFKRSQPGHLLV